MDIYLRKSKKENPHEAVTLQKAMAENKEFNHKPFMAVTRFPNKE